MSSTSATTTFDEVFDADGVPRAHAQALVAELERLGADSLVAAGALRDAIFMRQGITFDLTSPEGAVADRPFPLDLSRGSSRPPSGARSSAASRSGSARSTSSSTTSTTSARSSAPGSSPGR